MRVLTQNPKHSFQISRMQRRGVGLVELLIALAISAALLTAVAVAVDASFKSYAVNQSQAQLMQRARLTMHRLTTYIRSTDLHVPDDDDALDSFEGGVITQDSAIRMMTDGTNGLIFRQTGNELQMVPFTIVGTTLTEGTPQKMLGGVGAGDFVITFEPQRSLQSVKIGGNYDQLKRASITLTVHPSADTAVKGEEMDASVTLSTSIMPRRNIW